MPAWLLQALKLAEELGSEVPHSHVSSCGNRKYVQLRHRGALKNFSSYGWLATACVAADVARLWAWQLMDGMSDTTFNVPGIDYSGDAELLRALQCCGDNYKRVREYLRRILLPGETGGAGGGPGGARKRKQLDGCTEECEQPGGGAAGRERPVGRAVGQRTTWFDDQGRMFKRVTYDMLTRSRWQPKDTDFVRVFDPSAGLVTLVHEASRREFSLHVSNNRQRSSSEPGGGTISGPPPVAGPAEQQQLSPRPYANRLFVFRANSGRLPLMMDVKRFLRDLPATLNDTLVLAPWLTPAGERTTQAAVSVHRCSEARAPPGGQQLQQQQQAQHQPPLSQQQARQAAGAPRDLPQGCSSSAGGSHPPPTPSKAAGEAPQPTAAPAPDLGVVDETQTVAVFDALRACWSTAACSPEPSNGTHSCG